MSVPCVLEFSRNRCTSVEQLDEHTMRSSCRLQDTLTEAFVEIMVGLPNLEIKDVTGEVRRTYQDECRRPVEALQKVIGVRIGSGMLKIIKGLIGEGTDCGQLAFMVEECCHGVILAFTKDSLPRPPSEPDTEPDPEEVKKYFADLVRSNIRLYNRCAAFAPGSSMVEGVEPPK
ncbi:MAG: hypothetical protein V1742_09345 [Pseudomonadota bacterium]